MDNIYFVEKLGVYRHGVYFISSDKNEAICKADSLALSDIDDYHCW